MKVSLSALVCLWLFILGVLVGRGYAPVRFDIELLQDKLAKLKEATVEETVQRYQVAFKEVDKQVDLGFHEALKGTKTDLSDDALPLSREPETSETLSVKREKELPKKTRAPEFRKKSKPVVSKPEISKPWTIQVVATQDEAYGKGLIEGLKKKGFSAYLTTAEIPDRGTWYRVRVGGYAGRNEAEADCDRLKKERFSPMIIAP